MFSSQVTHYNYQYEGKFENLLYLQKHFNYYFISILWFWTPCWRPHVDISIVSVNIYIELLHRLSGFTFGYTTLSLAEKSNNPLSAGPAYVNVLTRGDLSSLRWIESPLRYFRAEDHPSRDLCSVYYTSLNFRDVMLATGKLPPDAIPGIMFSTSLKISSENVFEHLFFIWGLCAKCQNSRILKFPWYFLTFSETEKYDFPDCLCQFS